MTPKEALKVIDKVHKYPCPYGIGGTAWMYIRNCIEKKIPQKPNFQGDGYADGELVYDYAECPVCGCDFEEETRDWGCKFCPDCGQALDWGNT